MSTRSLIGAKVGDEYRVIYSHWDGYLDRVGSMLHLYYDNDVIIKNLMDLGDVFALYQSIECPDGHTFDTPVPGHTIFYGRDRGESNFESKDFNTKEELMEYLRDNGGYINYFYYYEDGEWSYSTGDLKMFEKMSSWFESGPVVT